jgi:hypothetical protein
LILGKLSCKEHSDEAGQFVGKRAGSARTGVRKERSDDRNPEKAQQEQRKPPKKWAARRRPVPTPALY